MGSLDARNRVCNGGVPKSVDADMRFSDVVECDIEKPLCSLVGEESPEGICR
jgi:archaellum component FlaC